MEVNQKNQQHPKNDYVIACKVWKPVEVGIALLRGVYRVYHQLAYLSWLVTFYQE